MGKFAAKFEDEECFCHLMNWKSIFVKFIWHYLRLKAFHLNFTIKAFELVFL